MKWKSSWAVMAMAVLPWAAEFQLQAELRAGFNAANFILMVEGDSAPSFLHSFAGGGATAEVIQTRRDGLDEKSPGSIRFDDFILRTGALAGSEFGKWIGKSLEGSFVGLSGSVKTFNHQMKTGPGFSFKDALLTEIAFPALDVSERNAGVLTLRLSPGFVKRETSSGEIVQPVGNTRQKKWLTSNFRFRLGDLPCDRVRKIDGFSLKPKIVEAVSGDARDLEVFSAGVEYPDLKLTISASSLKEWEAWHEDFLVNGNNGQDKEKKGHIEFLSEDFKTVLMTIDLDQVGLKRFQPYPERPTAQDAPAVFNVELYVERMRLTFHP